MKRFYKQAAVAGGESGYAVQLDGRPVRTPARNPLCVPAQALAAAIAAEWEAQGETINPVTMPLNALAEGALDQVIRERDRIIARIAAFSDSDMLCYRAGAEQAALAAHQAEQWDPLLDWARSRYDISFHLVNGIIHKPQPDETIDRLTAAVAAQDDFAIAAMLSLVGLTGSLVATLALVEEAFDPLTVWYQVNLEELWQEQQWGADELAVQNRTVRETAYLAAIRFLALSRT